MMPQIDEPPEHSYIIDADNGVETARLIQQDRLMTQAMGGLLPEQPPDVLPEEACVLDVACGPGLWACDLAFAQRERAIWVCGIDRSRSMLDCALATAQTMHLFETVEFRQGDVRRSLPFPDQTFDLINGRLLVGFLDRACWPRLLAECRRVLKPGGILRLTECELAISSSPSLQRIFGLLAEAMWRQGRTFSVDGQALAITARLGKLLLDAGLQDMQQRAFVLDSSYYQPLHYHLLKITDLTITLLQPYLLASGLVEAQTLRDLQQQMLLEMLEEDFTCLTFGLTAWAHAPLAPSPLLQEDAAAKPEPA